MRSVDEDRSEGQERPEIGLPSFMCFVDFILAGRDEDDRDTHTSGQPFKAIGYPFLTFVRSVIEELGGKALGSADDEGADETAVDDALRFAAHHLEFRILLFQDMDTTEGSVQRNQRFDSLFLAVQGDTEDVGVPFLTQDGSHLSHHVGGAHLIGGTDAMNTDFVTGDLSNEFCHIESFLAKIATPSAEIRQMLIKVSPAPNVTKMILGCRRMQN